MASYEHHEQMFHSKWDKVMPLGERVFGDKEKFRSWLKKPEHYTLTYTLDGLDQLEELLIQLDEGYF